MVTNIEGNMPERLQDLRINAGWSLSQLAREAGIDPATALRAERGDPVAPSSAKKIADALSKAHGKELQPTDIEGLNVRKTLSEK